MDTRDAQPEADLRLFDFITVADSALTPVRSFTSSSYQQDEYAAVYSSCSKSLPLLVPQVLGPGPIVLHSTVGVRDVDDIMISVQYLSDRTILVNEIPNENIIRSNLKKDFKGQNHVDAMDVFSKDTISLKTVHFAWFHDYNKEITAMSLSDDASVLIVSTGDVCLYLIPLLKLVRDAPHSTHTLNFSIVGQVDTSAGLPSLAAMAKNSDRLAAIGNGPRSRYVKSSPLNEPSVADSTSTSNDPSENLICIPVGAQIGAATLNPDARTVESITSLQWYSTTSKVAQQAIRLKRYEAVAQLFSEVTRVSVADGADPSTGIDIDSVLTEDELQLIDNLSSAPLRRLREFISPIGLDGLQSCEGSYALVGHASGRLSIVDLSSLIRHVRWSLSFDPGHPIESLQLFCDLASLVSSGLWTPPSVYSSSDIELILPVLESSDSSKAHSREDTTESLVETPARQPVLSAADRRRAMMNSLSSNSASSPVVASVLPQDGNRITVQNFVTMLTSLLDVSEAEKGKGWVLCPEHTSTATSSSHPLTVLPNPLDVNFLLLPYSLPIRGSAAATLWASQVPSHTSQLTSLSTLTADPSSSLYPLVLALCDYPAPLAPPDTSLLVRSSKHYFRICLESPGPNPMALRLSLAQSRIFASVSKSAPGLPIIGDPDDVRLRASLPPPAHTLSILEHASDAAVRPRIEGLSEEKFPRELRPLAPVCRPGGYSAVTVSVSSDTVVPGMPPASSSKEPLNPLDFVTFGFALSLPLKQRPLPLESARVALALAERKVRHEQQQQLQLQQHQQDLLKEKSSREREKDRSKRLQSIPVVNSASLRKAGVLMVVPHWLPPTGAPAHSLSASLLLQALSRAQEQFQSDQLTAKKDSFSLTSLFKDSRERERERDVRPAPGDSLGRIAPAAVLFPAAVPSQPVAHVPLPALFTHEKALDSGFQPQRLAQSPARADVSVQRSEVTGHFVLSVFKFSADDRYLLYDPALGSSPIFEFLLPMRWSQQQSLVARLTYARIRQRLLAPIERVLALEEGKDGSSSFRFRPIADAGTEPEGSSETALALSSASDSGRDLFDSKDDFGQNENSEQDQELERVPPPTPVLPEPPAFNVTKVEDSRRKRRDWTSSAPRKDLNIDLSDSKLNDAASVHSQYSQHSQQSLHSLHSQHSQGSATYGSNNRRRVAPPRKTRLIQLRATHIAYLDSLIIIAENGVAAEKPADIEALTPTPVPYSPAAPASSEHNAEVDDHELIRKSARPEQARARSRSRGHSRSTSLNSSLADMDDHQHADSLAVAVYQPGGGAEDSAAPRARARRDNDASSAVSAASSLDFSARPSQMQAPRPLQPLDLDQAPSASAFGASSVITDSSVLDSPHLPSSVNGGADLRFDRNGLPHGSLMLSPTAQELPPGVRAPGPARVFVVSSNLAQRANRDFTKITTIMSKITKGELLFDEGNSYLSSKGGPDFAAARRAKEQLERQLIDPGRMIVPSEAILQSFELPIGEAVTGLKLVHLKSSAAAGTVSGSTGAVANSNGRTAVVVAQTTRGSFCVSGADIRDGTGLLVRLADSVLDDMSQPVSHLGFSDDEDEEHDLDSKMDGFELDLRRKDELLFEPRTYDDFYDDFVDRSKAPGAAAESLARARARALRRSRRKGLQGYLHGESSASFFSEQNAANFSVGAGGLPVPQAPAHLGPLSISVGRRLVPLERLSFALGISMTDTFTTRALDILAALVRANRLLVAVSQRSSMPGVATTIQALASSSGFHGNSGTALGEEGKRHRSRSRTLSVGSPGVSGSTPSAAIMQLLAAHAVTHSGNGSYSNTLNPSSGVVAGLLNHTQRLHPNDQLLVQMLLPSRNTPSTLSPLLQAAVAAFLDESASDFVTSSAAAHNFLELNNDPLFVDNQFLPTVPVGSGGALSLADKDSISSVPIISSYLSIIDSLTVPGATPAAPVVLQDSLSLASVSASRSSAPIAAFLPPLATAAIHALSLLSIAGTPPLKALQALARAGRPDLGVALGLSLLGVPLPAGHPGLSYLVLSSPPAHSLSPSDRRRVLQLVLQCQAACGGAWAAAAEATVDMAAPPPPAPLPSASSPAIVPALMGLRLSGRLPMLDRVSADPAHHGRTRLHEFMTGLMAPEIAEFFVNERLLSKDLLEMEDFSGKTPLHLAAKGPRGPEAVAVLLEARIVDKDSFAKCDKFGDNVLLSATTSPRFCDLLTVLQSFGLLVPPLLGALNGFRRSLLHLALSKSFADAVIKKALLLQEAAGDQIQLISPELLRAPDSQQQTPLHSLAESVRALPALEVLLAGGCVPAPADWLLLDKRGRTPLHSLLASVHGHAALNFLLAQGLLAPDSLQQLQRQPGQSPSASVSVTSQIAQFESFRPQDYVLPYPEVFESVPLGAACAHVPRSRAHDLYWLAHGSVRSSVEQEFARPRGSFALNPFEFRELIANMSVNSTAGTNGSGNSSTNNNNSKSNLFPVAAERIIPMLLDSGQVFEALLLAQYQGFDARAWRDSVDQQYSLTSGYSSLKDNADALSDDEPPSPLPSSPLVQQTLQAIANRSPALLTGDLASLMLLGGLGFAPILLTPAKKSVTLQSLSDAIWADPVALSVLLLSPALPVASLFPVPVDTALDMDKNEFSSVDDAARVLLTRKDLWFASESSSSGAPTGSSAGEGLGQAEDAPGIGEVRTIVRAAHPAYLRARLLSAHVRARDGLPVLPHPCSIPYVTLALGRIVGSGVQGLHACMLRLWSQYLIPEVYASAPSPGVESTAVVDSAVDEFQREQLAFHSLEEDVRLPFPSRLFVFDRSISSTFSVSSKNKEIVSALPKKAIVAELNSDKVYELNEASKDPFKLLPEYHISLSETTQGDYEENRVGSVGLLALFQVGAQCSTKNSSRTVLCGIVLSESADQDQDVAVGSANINSVVSGGLGTASDEGGITLPRHPYFENRVFSSMVLDSTSAENAQRLATYSLAIAAALHPCTEGLLPGRVHVRCPDSHARLCARCRFPRLLKHLQGWYSAPALLSLLLGAGHHAAAAVATLLENSGPSSRGALFTFRLSVFGAAAAEAGSESGLVSNPNDVFIGMGGDWSPQGIAAAVVESTKRRVLAYTDKHYRQYSLDPIVSAGGNSGDDLDVVPADMAALPGALLELLGFWSHFVDVLPTSELFTFLRLPQIKQKLGTVLFSTGADPALAASYATGMYEVVQRLGIPTNLLVEASALHR